MTFAAVTEPGQPVERALVDAVGADQRGEVVARRERGRSRAVSRSGKRSMLRLTLLPCCWPWATSKYAWVAKPVLPSSRPSPSSSTLVSTQ